MAEEKEKLIGQVVHYFSKIGVAVIKLSAPLSEGDLVHIIGGEETDFEQPVKSMQVDHKEITKAKKGDEVGLKVKEKVREGYKVFKI
jgi:putative protease